MCLLAMLPVAPLVCLLTCDVTRAAASAGGCHPSVSPDEAAVSAVVCASDVLTALETLPIPAYRLQQRFLVAVLPVHLAPEGAAALHARVTDVSSPFTCLPRHTILRI